MDIWVSVPNANATVAKQEFKIFVGDKPFEECELSDQRLLLINLANREALSANSQVATFLIKKWKMIVAAHIAKLEDTIVSETTKLRSANEMCVYNEASLRDEVRSMRESTNVHKLLSVLVILAAMFVAITGIAYLAWVIAAFTILINLSLYFNGKEEKKARQVGMAFEPTVAPEFGGSGSDFGL